MPKSHITELAPTLEKAIAIASSAHLGQTRIKKEKGLPYILHVLRVMLDKRFVSTREEQIVAVLHDVVEDTDWTLDNIRAEGYSEDVIEAIDAITKREGELYKDYLVRVESNSIARKVKLADLHDNNDPPTVKYSKAIQQLLAVELA